MPAFNKFNAFVEDVAEKVHNLGSDTLKILLITGTTAPTASDATYSESADTLNSSSAAQIATGNGYSDGGATVTITSSAQSSGTYKLVGNDVVFTASGGSIPASGTGIRYAVLYNATAGAAATRPLIGWWDYGSNVTLANGETFTVDLDQTNGILTIA